MKPSMALGSPGMTMGNCLGAKLMGKVTTYMLESAGAPVNSDEEDVRQWHLTNLTVAKIITTTLHMMVHNDPKADTVLQ